VCRQVRFAELLPQARRQHWELDRLMTTTGCGTQCGLCRPYLRAMLRDGVTEFTEVLPADIEGAPC
jgi:bacterioferritin-associated ferredoxin